MLMLILFYIYYLGTLVVSTYAPCPDVRQVLTPDLKMSTNSSLVFIDLSKGMSRLGGSALAQCFSQIGDEVPDLDCPDFLKAGFNTTQKLIQGSTICHVISSIFFKV